MSLTYTTLAASLHDATTMRKQQQTGNKKTAVLQQLTLSTNDRLAKTQRSMQRTELMIKRRCPGNEASPVGETSVLLYSLFAEIAAYTWISISSNTHCL